MALPTSLSRLIFECKRLDEAQAVSGTTLLERTVCISTQEIVNLRDQLRECRASLDSSEV